MNVEEHRPGLVVARVGAGLGPRGRRADRAAALPDPARLGGDRRLHDLAALRLGPRPTRRPRLAAALLTAAVAFGLGVPLAWVLATVANEASHLVLLLQESASGELALPDWIASRSWLREPIEQLRATWLVDTHAHARSDHAQPERGLEPAAQPRRRPRAQRDPVRDHADGALRALSRRRTRARAGPAAGEALLPRRARGLRGRHRSRRAGGGLRAARHCGRAGGDRRDRLRDLRRALAGAARHGDGARLVRSVRTDAGVARGRGGARARGRHGDRRSAWRSGARCS